MAFVKLDCGILDSTLWLDRDARELFITALLMAEPFELREPAIQIKIRTLEETGFVVPLGWYGMVHAASLGIIHRSGMDTERGLTALEKLGDPEMESRTPDFDGRRMVRVSGGFIVLNFAKFREKDHTSAERSKRYREKKMGRKTKVPKSHDKSPSAKYLANEARHEEAFKDGNIELADQIAAGEA